LDGEVADLFGSLTTVIEMDPFEFLEKIAYMLENRQIEYPKAWDMPMLLRRVFPQKLFQPLGDNMATVGDYELGN